MQDEEVRGRKVTESGTTGWVGRLDPCTLNGYNMANRVKIILSGALSMICLLLFVSGADADPLKEIHRPVYKEMRPKMAHFDPRKMPDPFLSYLVKRGQQISAKAEDARKREIENEERLKQQKLAAEERLKALKEARTDLQKMGLSQLTLTAIVQARDVAWAMVRDESGRGFVLKKGTHIGKNGGVVSKIAITEKKVIIKEPYLEKGLYIKYRPVEIELPDEVYE